MFKQQVKVLVEGRNAQGEVGAFIHYFSKATELGIFLEQNPNHLILQGEELSWVNQVLDNISDGYSYLTTKEVA
jgi:hypothetical protein